MYQKMVRKPYQKLVRSGENVGTYARLPESVLRDKRLSASSRCVYAELALGVWQCTTISLGQRLIGKRLGLSKTTVNAAISELAEHGHIEVKSLGGQRFTYHLTSNVFGQKQRDGEYEVATGPSGGKRIVSMPKGGKRSA